MEYRESSGSAMCKTNTLANVFCCSNLKSHFATMFLQLKICYSKEVWFRPCLLCPALLSLFFLAHELFPNLYKCTDFFLLNYLNIQPSLECITLLILSISPPVCISAFSPSFFPPLPLSLCQGLKWASPCRVSALLLKYFPSHLLIPTYCLLGSLSIHLSLNRCQLLESK